jgi:hypothetical protein
LQASILLSGGVLRCCWYKPTSLNEGRGRARGWWMVVVVRRE